MTFYDFNLILHGKVVKCSKNTLIICLKGEERPDHSIIGDECRVVVEQSRRW